MDEHYRLLEFGDEVRRRLDAGDREAASAALRQFAGLLTAHVRREEAGVFAALLADGEFADAVLELEGEHVELDDALASLDLDAPEARTVVDRLLAHLSEHIDKENLGIFPVAVVSLGAAGWDMVSRAETADGATAGAVASALPGGRGELRRDLPNLPTDQRRRGD